MTSSLKDCVHLLLSFLVLVLARGLCLSVLLACTVLYGVYIDRIPASASTIASGLLGEVSSGKAAIIILLLS